MLPQAAAIEIWKQIENRAPPHVEADQTHRRSRRGKGVRIFRVGRRTAGFWPASAAERAQGLRRSIQRRVSVAARNADQLHRDGLAGAVHFCAAFKRRSAKPVQWYTLHLRFIRGHLEKYPPMV